MASVAPKGRSLIPTSHSSSDRPLAWLDERRHERPPPQLRDRQLGRLGLEPAQRYERARRGELIHIDVKKLGRIARPGHRITGPAGRRTKGYHRRRYEQGWEFVHIAIDDCTRLAYAEVLDDEKATTVAAFLRRAVAFYSRHGITTERLLTDG